MFGYDAVASYLNIENDLLARYSDYEEMDDMPEVSSSIDIYSDDSTQPDATNRRSMWIVTKDKNIENILDRDLFQRTLRMDEEIWDIARTLVKYGNDFEELLVNQNGVVGFNFLPPATIRRIEGPRGEHYGFVQDFRGRYGYTPYDFKAMLTSRMKGVTSPQEKNMPVNSADYQRPDRKKVVAFEDWEITHFRLRGRQRRSIYGHSALEAGRWIWKRLQLLEDSALIYRLQRAPERFAFYVDVGDLPPAEALAYVNRVKQAYKKKRFFDPSTGKLNLRWEPLSQDDDFWVPVRQGKEGARIEVLGAPAWQHMDDIEYFRDKLFAALKVPKSYLGQEQGVARQILSSEDVRFARTILRVQRELRNGMGKVCRVHMAAIGMDPLAADYDIRMTVPSSIFDLAQMEVRNARADLAARMKEFVSEYWLLSRIFELSDGEIEMIVKQREQDAMRMARIGANAQDKASDIMVKGQIKRVPAMQQAGLMADPSQMQAQGAEQAPAEATAEDAYKYYDSFVRHLSEGKPGEMPVWALHSLRQSGIRERELMSGNRESEKRAEEKLYKLLRNDKRVNGQLQELRGLYRDIISQTRGQ
jgi:hypothetical protein